MLHACDQRFDVTGNLENFYELNKALVSQKPKSFQDYLSHQIFRHIYEALNIYENKN